MEEIIWLSKARKDLIEIYNYISEDSVYYAIKTINKIVKKAELLYNFPYMGRKIEELSKGDYRELIYKSYKIIYKIDSSKIYIHRIWHSARLISNKILN